MNEERKTEEFLSFAMQGEMQGMLRTAQLVKVLRLDRSAIVQIPDMPAAVVGVCLWEGAVLWLVDLGYLLGLTPLFTPDYLEEKCSVLVARAGTLENPQGEQLGILVDKVGKVMHCQMTALQKSHAKIKEAKCIRGSWQNDRGESWLVLDAEAIASSLSSS